MENISKITYQEKEIYLLGTAHVSKTSQQDVKQLVDEVNPDSLCIELDQQRYQALMNPKKWEDTDIIQVIKQKRYYYMLVNLILSSYQKKVASKLEVNAGLEMMEAIKLSKEKKIKLVLVDRNIQTTFKRMYHQHSFFAKIKLFVSLFASIFEDDDISEADIEQMKQQDTLTSALNEVSKTFPTVAKVLVHERDEVLAYKIKNAPGDKIVAIVGAAHVPGIKEAILKEQDIKELESIGQPSKVGKLIKWLIPLTLIAMIIFLFFKNTDLGLAQLISWTLWNGSLSALGCLIALGHPLTILTAFIMAPITSLNPLLAAGWFAGITEAVIRKPKVIDFQNIHQDINHLKSFYHNRILRVLLVVILANLFSTIGTLIGGFEIINNFITHIL